MKQFHLRNIIGLYQAGVQGKIRVRDKWNAWTNAPWPEVYSQM